MHLKCEETEIPTADGLFEVPWRMCGRARTGALCLVLEPVLPTAVLPCR